MTRSWGRGLLKEQAWVVRGREGKGKETPQGRPEKVSKHPAVRGSEMGGGVEIEFSEANFAPLAL